MSVFRYVFLLDFAVMRCLLSFSAVLRWRQSPNVPLIIIP